MVYEKDVVWFEIAVNDALLVGCVQGQQRGLQDAAGGRQIDGPAPLELVAEALPLQVLHHEVGLPLLGDAEIHYVDDISMLDGRSGLGLSEKTLDDILSGRELGVEELDRHLLADGDVLTEVHRPHAPLSEQPVDLILTVQGFPCVVMSGHRSPKIRLLGAVYQGHIVRQPSISSIAHAKGRL